MNWRNWWSRLRAYVDRWRRYVVEHRKSIAIGFAIFVAAAIAFRLARGAFGFWTMDDAGITYGLAFELVDHHSLGANVEGTPVEGYSNPLLFFLVALLRLVGVFDPITTHIRLEMLVFAGMVTLVWSMLRNATGEIAAVLAALAFLAIELVTPATTVWYGSGLENVWVSAGLVLLLWVCVRTARGVPLSPVWGNAAFLVAIVRPEAPVYVAAFYGTLAAFARPQDLAWREHVRRIGRALVVTVALYVVFLAWRRIAYGAWLPNTYYAKLHGAQDHWQHLRDYVVGGIFPYCRAALFASSVIALFFVSKLERVASIVVGFLVASLALPIAAGADWMGEHRFATPFLAMAHVAYVTLLAAALANLTQARIRSWRVAHVLAFVSVVAVAGLLKYDRLAVRDDISLNGSTLQAVGIGAASRWEQAQRLGVPYPVVLTPDAGAQLVVGSLQMLDNGFLTDFQMARFGRNFVDGHRDQRVLDQYQHEERRPDLVSIHEAFPLNRSYLNTRYLPPGSGRFMWPRRDVVEATTEHARLVYDDGRIRIYLSPDTVATSAPSGLVRCELIVAWTDIDLDGEVRGSVARGDRDHLRLFAYQRERTGVEHFALLLGAPTRVGSYPVTLELERDGTTTPLGQPFSIEVTNDVRPAIAAALDAPTPMQAARRLAWLREQRVARLGMTAFRVHAKAIERSHFDRTSDGGAFLALRHNARLAASAEVEAPIRAAELVVMRTLFDTCAKRVVCLGRVVDRLRRLGYLHAVSRVPDVANELAEARDRLDTLNETERYQVLVGLTLAIPEDIDLQWQLLKLRRKLATQPSPFPSIE